MFSMVAGALLMVASPAQAVPPERAASAAEQVTEMKRSAGKSGLALSDLSRQYTQFKAQKGKQARPDDFAPRFNVLQVSNGYVVVDAVAKPGKAGALKTDLESLGLKGASVYKNVVSGRFPIDALKSVEGVATLHHMRPSFARTQVGLVDSQGDVSMRSKTAKAQFGVTGAGQAVGVLSDSFDAAAIGCAGPLDPTVTMTTAADDIASGDLPPVTVLQDIADCGSIDEGRGMAQLIHDVAPGADILFRSAFNGYADFANGIIELADAGATVIVDDIIYFAEPMFMDGLIAQATDQVNARGIPYFSSAGNRGYDSYQDGYREVEGLRELEGFLLQDFDPGAGVDYTQSVTVPPGTQVVFSFQWDEPFFTDTNGLASSASDMDVQVFDTDFNSCYFTFCAGGDVIQIFGQDDNINGTGDPLEIFAIINFSAEPKEVQITLQRFAGPAPSLLKYVVFNPVTINEWDTNSGASFGKAMANGAFGTGASAWFNTQPYNPSCTICRPARINSFSSAGGTPILFDAQGNRLPVPEIRNKPNATGPDGADTTFFGFKFPFKVPRDDRRYPNFSGTSASAPHVAAVAALMLDASPWLDADDVFAILEATAEDMDDFRTTDPDIGFDFGTGYGFVNAEAALAGARGDVCHNGNTITVKQAGAVAAHLAHGDKLGGC
jgi:subtilisin family serine protease